MPSFRTLKGHRVPKTARKGEVTGLLAVDRAVTVIEAVRGAGEATLAQIARVAALSEPTTLRYLNALRKHQIVIRDPKGASYRLGVRLHDWGATAPSGLDPRTAALEPLDRLSAELGETVELVGVEGGRVVVLTTRPGPHSVSRVTHVGEVERWHSTAVGKAILSNASASFVDTVLAAEQLTRFTRHTITSQGRLREELEASRVRDYAVDNEEGELGLRCVAVSLRGRSGEHIYAIGVSGPAYRMTPDREPQIVRSLRSAAAEIEFALGVPRAH